MIRESAASNEPGAVAEARVALAAAATAEPSVIPAPNTMVERTLTKLASARRRADGLLWSEGASFVRIAVRPESLERAGAVLRQVVAAAETAGLRLAKHEGGAVWLCDGETVGFELVEVTDQIPHVATTDELEAVEKWRRDREETHRRFGYWRDWGEPRIPKWEHRHQGRLAIRLEEVRIQSGHSPWGDAIRRNFTDSRTREITKAIPRIVGTIGAMAAAKKANREFEVKRKAAAAKAAREYEELQRRRALEQKTIVILEKLLIDHEAEARLRSVADALRVRNGGGGRFARFLEWMDLRLAAMGMENSPAAIEDRLTAAGLFEPTDAEG